MIRIAILASGSGTNAEAIMSFLKEDDEAEVTLILSNKPDAFVLKRAAKYEVPSVVFSSNELQNGVVLEKLRDNHIDFIVLAGFLLLIPKDIIRAYPDRILNIHPALLPKYGGKGMYGNFVHEAVIESGDNESGITIHHVNEHYDEGDIIFQASCPVYSDDTPELLANRIHSLEHKHYPSIVAKVAKEI